MNSKFKKFNKILMMSVAILLCLVLLSTSVVSGIFARYVIKREAVTTVSLKAFGLTLTVDGLPGKTTINEEDYDENSAKITVSGISLAPGETLSNVVKFTITGDKATVATDLKIQVTESHTGFTVPTAVSGKSEQDYIPIGIKATTKKNTTVLKDDVTILSAWKVVAKSTSIQNDIVAGIKASTGLGFSAVANVANAAKYTLCAANAAPAITELSFSFYSPKEETASELTKDKTNIVQTYLGTRTTQPSMTVTFIVSLEQA